MEVSQKEILQALSILAEVLDSVTTSELEREMITDLQYWLMMPDRFTPHGNPRPKV